MANQITCRCGYVAKDVNDCFEHIQMMADYKHTEEHEFNFMVQE